MVGGIASYSFKLYSEAIIIKTIWYYMLSPNIYEQLIYDNEVGCMM